MSNWQVTEEDFLKDVSKHEMIVMHDQDTYRHLRFKKPNSIDMYFDLITYPGYLVYSGDMGCYVFSRINDMFQFFRNPDGDQLAVHQINPHYWMEKLEAQCRDGATEFSHEKFIANVRRWMNEGEHITPEIREDVEDILIDDCESHTEEECMRAVMDYDFTDKEGNRMHFPVFWEVNNRVYTGRFIWCCYAIVWGIKKYDEYQILLKSLR